MRVMAALVISVFGLGSPGAQQARSSFDAQTLVGASTAGQSTTRAAATFKVASVRESTPDARPSQRILDRRLEFTNVRMRFIIATAFGIDATRVSGPDWVATTGFDIHATYPEGVGRERVPEMLRTLLADRFGLVARVETRPSDGYELVVGERELTLREVAPVDELTKAFPPDPAVTSAPGFDSTSEALVQGPQRTMVINLGMRTVTRRSLYERVFTARRTVELNAIRMSMDEFADFLSSNVDRPVVNATGLPGLYQFRVELDGDASAARRLVSAGITTTVQGTLLTEPTGYSTLKAVEGLGLKLDPRQVPLDFVVIEKINRTPVEN